MFGHGGERYSRPSGVEPPSVRDSAGGNDVTTMWSKDLPAAAAAMPHAGFSGEGAASSSAHAHAATAHAATATAGCRTDRDGEAIREATRLAAWEDEGGTTSGGGQAPRRRVC